MGSSFQEQRPQRKHLGGWPRAVLKGRGMEQFLCHLPAVPYIFPAVLRDISERGRDLEQILSQYITFVKPAFEEFCLPVSKGSNTHGRLTKVLHTPPSSSGKYFVPRSSVSLPYLAPCQKALAKTGRWGCQCCQDKVGWGLFIQPLPLW